MEPNTNDPRRRYLEQYGSTLVMNTYLKVALFAVSMALLGTIGLSFSMFSWARNQKPLIVRIDEVGRATPINYSAFDYSPQAVTVKLDKTIIDQLKLYAEFIDSTQEHVVNEALGLTFKKDRDFQEWLDSRKGARNEKTS